MRDFLKYLFASITGTIIGLVTLLTLLGLGAGGLAFLAFSTFSSGPEVGIEDPSILVFDLSLNITDSVPPSGPSLVVEEALSGASLKTLSLRQVLDSLQQAKTDDRVVGLYLKGNTSSGFATLHEIRQALEDFKESGKPIFAYTLGWSEPDYYLTSLADTLVLNPVGFLEINGFRSEAMFFAAALRKYGVGVQILKAGRYKSAVEPFILGKRSPEDRQQTQKLLDDLWQEFLDTTGPSRNLSPQKLQAIVNEKGLLTAIDAKSLGFVDQISYLDETLEDLKTLTESEVDDASFRQIALADYASQLKDSTTQSGKNRVAVVYAEGSIVSGEGGNDLIGGDSLSRRLRELRLDPKIKAVVLRVNTPGGGATASEVIMREVQLMGDQKPIVVSMGDLAASGGYLISTYADRIFASPNTITGSIGVFGLLLNVQKIANDNGVTWDVVKTGTYADINTSVRPKTPAELEIQQGVVDELYDRFVGTVAQSRDLPEAKVAEIAQGRVWSGIEAQKLGLVDEIGGLTEAIATAAELADLGDDWRIEEYPKPRQFEDEILDRLFSTSNQLTLGPSDALTLRLRQVRAELNTLQTLNDPYGAYARLPFSTHID